MIVLYLKALVAIALAAPAPSLGRVGAGSAPWPGAGASPNPRPWLVAGLVTIWSLRLGLPIAVRITGIADDPRDAALAREGVAASPRKMFIFLQNPASTMFSLPRHDGAVR
jgi:steroid 5-alpha reductase family enzyme